MKRNIQDALSQLKCLLKINLDFGKVGFTFNKHLVLLLKMLSQENPLEEVYMHFNVIFRESHVFFYITDTQYSYILLTYQ